jgi:hypothetical protein
VSIMNGGIRGISIAAIVLGGGLHADDARQRLAAMARR